MIDLNKIIVYYFNYIHSLKHLYDLRSIFFSFSFRKKAFIGFHIKIFLYSQKNILNSISKINIFIQFPFLFLNGYEVNLLISITFHFSI